MTSRLSLFNFQGPITTRSRGQLCYYITELLLCQYFFESFLKFFSGYLLSVFLGSLISVTQQFSFVKYFFKLFSSFFLDLFHCVLSRDSLIILSLLFRFVNPFFDIFFVLLFNCTSNNHKRFVLYNFNNNRFTTLKRQSVLPPCHIVLYNKLKNYNLHYHLIFP